MERRGSASRNRAQISVFIIIAVVIVLALVLLTFLSGKGYISEYGLTTTDKISRMIEDCQRLEAQRAIEVLGSNGGTLKGKAQYLQHIAKTPTIEEVSEEIAEEIDRKLLACLEDLASLKALGYEVHKSNPTTQVDIYPDSSVITTAWSIKLTRSEKTLNLDTFKTIIEDVRIVDYLKDTQTIVHEQPEQKVDLTVLRERNVNIHIVAVSDNTAQYTIYRQGIPKEFSFMLLY
ncbi:hypothetical protein H6504_00585 [Candidatus Woesearchaeota archaeon]|nr:hypothetical protein [Candidatus Woesearchaeota archaeon]